MHIYRFKIKFEDQDDFSREFELRSDQTFKDFFFAIAGNLNLDQNTLSSFYICDHKFRKREEISLVDMNPETFEESRRRVLVMRDCRLNDYIDDPHQKLLLVYDYLNYWSFYIELIRIVPADPMQTYPRLFRSEGEIPRELISKVTDDFGPGEEDFPDEGDVLVEGYDQDDLDAFEGEEGYPEEEENNLEGFDEEKIL